MLADVAVEIADIDRNALLDRELAEHRRVFEATAALPREVLFSAVDVLEQALRGGGKILLFGNGGSASDAQHLAAELMIRYQQDRPAFAAVALTADSCSLTACANDFGFETVFERQVAGLGRANDVAFGLSTSGRSVNVLRGLRQARTMGMKTIGMTGGQPSEMTDLCDVLIAVPSTTTARIQEMHIMVGHILCKTLERRLGLV